MSESARHPERLLRRLEWTVIRRLDGVLQGDYRTLFRGVGLDLADLREYQYHDDVRYIDWNVTARLQTPYVREYHEDREVTAWFLLDLTASMDVGAGAVPKRSVSAEFVTVLARLLTRHGNRVGALCYDGRVDTVIPARSGRRHVLHILHRLSSRPPRARPDRDGPGGAPADGRAARAPALAPLRRLRLPQRARLDGAARPSRAAPRRRGGAALRPAGAGAARPGAARDAGRRDRRAALRGHARPRLPATLRGRRRAARGGASGRRSPGPGWTRSSWRPTATSSRRSSGSPTSASGEASWRRAAGSRTTSSRRRPARVGASLAGRP